MAELQLSDVDGTIPGRAALVSINLGKPGEEMSPPQFAPFVEGEYTCTDPIKSAWDLWESIKGDFPGSEAAVISNDRAKYLMYARMCGELIGPGDYSPSEYLEVM